MKKRVRYVLLGVIAYGVFLVVTFPAAYAYRLIQNQLDGIQLGSVDGTVWSGSAQILKINDFYLQDIDWKIQFLPLFLGRLELKLNSADKEFKFSTHAGRTLGGMVYIRGFQGRFPVASLQAMTPYPVPALQGQLVFDGLEIALTDGKYVKGTGELLWKEAVATVSSPLDLGGFAVELKTEGQEITGMLKDTGGPLQAEGVLKLSAEGRYQFNGKFTPRDGGGKLAQNLRMLGSPGPAGGYELSYDGHAPVPALQ